MYLFLIVVAAIICAPLIGGILSAIVLLPVSLLCSFVNWMSSKPKDDEEED